jgi:hypothetical protein
MGDLHNELRRTPLPGALSRALGLTKGVEGLERISETLDVGLDLWALPEWAYLRRERLCSGWQSQAGVAGEYSAISLVNPAGSGMILVAERAVGVVGAAMYVNTTIYGAAAAIGAAGTSLANRDTRWEPATNRPVGQLWLGTTAAAPGGAYSLSGLQGSTTVNSDAVLAPVVLGPGTALIIWGGTVNTSLRYTVVWRERRAFPGELE